MNRTSSVWVCMWHPETTPTQSPGEKKLVKGLQNKGTFLLSVLFIYDDHYQMILVTLTLRKTSSRVV